MADKLLIRAYDVEVGDCVYCRIPNAKILDDGSIDDFHMLIDCGTRNSKQLPKAALRHLKEEMLPHTTDGKSRLDLVVVTHEHQDHIKGFDPEDFEDIDIGAIWMSAAMDPEHLQAETTRSLTGAAKAAMRQIAAQGLALDPIMEELVDAFSIGNEEAMDALRDSFPAAYGLAPKYVHAGMSNETLDVPLANAKISILGPEQDIDRFYLGSEADERIRTLHGSVALGESVAPEATPQNISPADFRNLRSHMLSSSFAFAELASRVQNNTCIVFMLEWEGRRLLFVGDCEWEHEFEEGKQNGGWNVMWHQQNEMLNKPLDFLKIGHHGSVNSTPWNDLQDGTETEPSRILDAILPISTDGSATASAVVSTKRKNYETIPDCALLSVIGERVATVRNYDEALSEAGIDPSELPKFNEFERSWIRNPQPLRTDLESLITGQPFVDIDIDPVN